MKKRIFLSAIVVVILMIGVMLIGYFTSHKKTSIDSRAVNYNSRIKKPKDFSAEKIIVPGFSEIKVKEGAAKANVVFSNPSFNHVYFKYTITLVDPNKKLLETELIKPGKAIIGLPLPKNLCKGNYKLKIAIKTYNISNQKELNGRINETTLKELNGSVNETTLQID